MVFKETEFQLKDGRTALLRSPCEEDAAEMLLAGATAVQVGAANLADPMVCKKIIDGLPGVLERLGVQDINELIGGAH